MPPPTDIMTCLPMESGYSRGMNSPDTLPTPETESPSPEHGPLFHLLCFILLPVLLLATLVGSITIFAVDWFNVDEPECQSLAECAESGALIRLNRRLQWGAEPDERGREGRTALALAAYYGHADCVKALLEAGADTGARDNDGRTPLMLAAEAGRVRCVKALLQGGAAAHLQQKDGTTALMLAAGCNFPDCLSALLRGNAPMEQRAANDWTALMYAAAMGRTECLSRLIQAGANVNAALASPTALEMARLRHFTDCVRLLEAAGAK